MIHSEILDELQKRFERMNLDFYREKEFEVHNTHGEIDIYGIDWINHKVFAIEVKGHYSQENNNKVRKQIKKDLEYLTFCFPNYKLIGMYAYSENNKRGYMVTKLK